MPAEMDPRLRDWLDVVDFYWQRSGVAETERTRMRAELETDLLQSLAGGASVDDLVAVDPADFAAEVAAADEVPSGVLRTDPELTDASLLATVLGGAVLGAVLAWVTVYRYGLQVVDGMGLSYADEGLAVIALHTLAACLCVATALGAVAIRFRTRLGDRLRRALTLVGILFALGGFVSIGPTVAFASAFGYSTATDIVVIEVAIVIACCSLGVLAASRLLRLPRSAPR